MDIISKGFFKEIIGSTQNAPSIKDYILKGSDDPIEKICAYLDSGLPLVICPGVVSDVIDKTKGIAGSPSILTDGKWAWSGLLSYYVKNYKLKLDSEFLETMASNDWKIPIIEEDLDYSNIFLDGNQL